MKPRDPGIPAALVCVVTAASLLACGEVTTAASGDTCVEGDAMCFEHSGYILECTEDGTWEARPCDEGLLCYEGECQDLVCVPGSAKCDNNSLVKCLDDGQGYLYPEPCESDEACHEGECLPVICEDGETRCADDETLERCEGSGTVWVRESCPEGYSCLAEGACLPSECEAGDTMCNKDRLFTCDDDGEWTVEPCAEGQECFMGRCVSCVNDQHCDLGEICDNGECVATSPVLITTTLPQGTVGSFYEEGLVVEGGRPPHEWELTSGDLPAGIALDQSGTLSGTPSDAGEESFTIQVTDQHGENDSREYSLLIVPIGDGPEITTTSLPPADHGLPYEAEMHASGGREPYAWQVFDGALPPGIEIGSGGSLFGTPEQIGDFPFTVRVLDASEVPGFDTKDLSITVEIAPLVIVGEEEYGFGDYKIIVLSMIAPYLPYSEQLEAQGGLPPYLWNKTDPPDIIEQWVEDWGLPPDLSLNSEGVVSGMVTDTSDAVELDIPFTDIKLHGYFFSAEVTDDQDPSDRAEAVFCIPTMSL